MKYILEKAPVQYYSEIHQHKQIMFSFCNKKGDLLTQMFHWVKCRDFLSDVLLAEEIKQALSKYCFVYDPNKQQIDRDKTRLLLKFKHTKEIAYLLDNLSILNKIEKSNGFLPTIVRKVDEEICLVEGSKRWLNSTFSLNLYTFLLKAMSYEYQDKDCWLEELKEEDTNEGHYACSFIPQFETIISTSLKKLFGKGISVHGYPKAFSNVSFVHDNGGVLTLFRKGAENFNSTKNNEYYKRLVSLIEKV